jgi:hypothetical protein
MEHDCKFENTIIEMAGDVKVLASEFKAMNGALRNTKQGYENHEKESKEYRDKVTIIWSAIHTIKWAIVLVFGSGLVWRLIEFFTKSK